MASSSSSSSSHDLAAPRPANGSFTSNHGGEDDDTAIDLLGILFNTMVKFYDEAARRLPIGEMPELVGCILDGGHCYGLPRHRQRRNPAAHRRIIIPL
uniref:PIR2-like helical domain-containing protein n=1 Tax=Leersia perrieri TaxID=77586 RepID=A0A0D9WT14_9ORYZ